MKVLDIIKPGTQFAATQVIVKSSSYIISSSLNIVLLFLSFIAEPAPSPKNESTVDVAYVASRSVPKELAEQSQATWNPSVRFSDSSRSLPALAPGYLPHSIVLEPHVEADCP